MSTFNESNTVRTFIFQKQQADGNVDSGVAYEVTGFHPIPRIGETVGFIDERSDDNNKSGYVESVVHQFVWKYDQATDSNKLLHGIQIILK